MSTSTYYRILMKNKRRPELRGKPPTQREMELSRHLTTEKILTADFYNRMSTTGMRPEEKEKFLQDSSSCRFG